MLGWEPTYTLEDLVRDMISSDLALFSRDKYLMEGGHKVMSANE
jgi:GDPmannose 4,6-dehydratase